MPLGDTTKEVKAETNAAMKVKKAADALIKAMEDLATTEANLMRAKSHVSRTKKDIDLRTTQLGAATPENKPGVQLSLDEAQADLVEAKFAARKWATLKTCAEFRIKSILSILDGAGIMTRADVETGIGA